MAHACADGTLTTDGDNWRLLAKGATRDGKTYCHLASTTRRRAQKNGYVPVQMCDWIDEAIASQLLLK